MGLARRERDGSEAYPASRSESQERALLAFRGLVRLRSRSAPQRGGVGKALSRGDYFPVSCEKVSRKSDNAWTLQSRHGVCSLTVAVATSRGKLCGGSHRLRIVDLLALPAICPEPARCGGIGRHVGGRRSYARDLHRLSVSLADDRSGVRD